VLLHVFEQWQCLSVLAGPTGRPSAESLAFELYPTRRPHSVFHRDLDPVGCGSRAIT